MKVSVITAVYNNRDTVEKALLSVKNQTYSDIEHIVIDGQSSDGSLDIVKSFDSVSKIVSEKDSGIYDALNKGIKLASGDIIGFLHADDFFADKNVVEKIVEKFYSEAPDGIYGDLVYVSKDTRKIIRYWKSQYFLPGYLKKGWMPPHPTLFLRKEVYDKIGLFDLSFSISADYEFVLRLFKNDDFLLLYLPGVITCMSWGGKSNRSLKNILIKMKEDYRAIRKHKIGGLEVLLRKNFSKINQFFVSDMPENFSCGKEKMR